MTCLSDLISSNTGNNDSKSSPAGREGTGVRWPCAVAALVTRYLDKSVKTGPTRSSRMGGRRGHCKLYYKRDEGELKKKKSGDLSTCLIYLSEPQVMRREWRRYL